MNRSLDTKGYFALYLLIVLMSVAYLFVVGASVLRLQYIYWNGEFAFRVQNLPWPWFRNIAPHFVEGSYWIPYWCAVILLFAYKERVKFLFWIRRFSFFLIGLYLAIIAINAFIIYFLPRLCGRSADFTHLTPHSACRFISPVGTEIAGAALLVLLSLKHQHRIIKLLMIISAFVIGLSLLNQGVSFPFQMICSVLLASFCSVIAYIIWGLRRSTLYNF